MSSFENIQSIAKQNARHITKYNLNFVCDLKKNYIRILKSNNKLEVSYNENVNHKGRVNQISKILNSEKLPNNINFFLDISDGCVNEGYIAFSRKKTSSVSLIPDPYQINGIPFINNDLNFTEKKNKAIFVGSATGRSLLLDNERIMTGKYVYDNKLTSIDYFLTKNKCITSDILSFFNNDEYKNIFTDFISKDEQLKYKYIYSIDGISAAWDRPVWIMSSKSILIKPEITWELWYYPLMKNNFHFIESNIKELDKTVNYLNNNPKICDEIINNANQFTSTYNSVKAAEIYFEEYFEEICFLYGK